MDTKASVTQFEVTRKVNGKNGIQNELPNLLSIFYKWAAKDMLVNLHNANKQTNKQTHNSFCVFSI